MAQNIQIAGATFNAVPSIVVPVAGGGSATFVDPSPTTAAAADVASGKLFFDALGVLTQGTASGGGGGGNYPWFGPGTTFVERKLNKTINLKSDTTFDSWTASTSASTIKAASSSKDFSIDGDYNNAYWVILRAYVDIAYLSGVTLQNIPRRTVQYYSYLIFPHFTSTNAWVDDTPNAVTYATQTNRAGMRYYGNTTGSPFFANSVSYGPCYLSASPAISISENTVNIQLAAIKARCHNLYFATSRKASIDSANTNMVITADVYKTPVPNSYVSWLIEQARVDMTSGL